MRGESASRRRSLAICLGLAVAHLVTAVRGQVQQEQSLIEDTFTPAPGHGSARRP